MAEILTTAASSPWSLTISRSGTLEMNTANRYLDRKIQVSVPAAEFAYVQTVTGETPANRVPLVTSAGYSALNYIEQITIPEGVNATRRQLNVSQENYTNLNIIGSPSTHGRVYINGYRSHVFVATEANTDVTISQFYLASNTNSNGTINYLYVGKTSSHNDDKRGYIQRLDIRGQNSSGSSQDAIGTLNVGIYDSENNIYYRNAKITTINNYNVISNINLSNGQIDNLYGTGSASIGKSQTLNSFSLVSGTSTSRTYLTNLNVPTFSTINNLTLGGIITSLTANKGYISALNLDNTNSYIGNLYGTGYITTLSEYTLAKYINNGTLTLLSGAGEITTDSGTGDIITKTGTRIIKHLGNSSITGILNIDNNTYGTINVWGGKTENRGVSIENHVVTVDGNGTAAGTAVTNTDGDLITTSPSKITGGELTVSGFTLSSTNDSGVFIVRNAANYTVSSPGWATTAGSGLSKETKYVKGVTITAPSSGERTFFIEVPNGSSSSNVKFTFHIKSDYNVYVDNI